MRSKAQFKSHPIHPMLIPFPIAFFLGTLVFHVAGWWMARMLWLQVAYYLNIAGVISALVVAVPGFIDYLYTVPPKSSGKKRAATHGIINVTIVVLFAIAFIWRRQGADSQYGLLALEVVGCGLLVWSGWLGGTLVYRNQIGVDPRYADA